jgi:hypothetical protein
MTSNKKYEIIRVAQENQHMLKRIQERSSFYNVDKWERDYQKNQYYKKNHCVFPCIDFYRTQKAGGAGYRQASFPQKKKYATYNDHFDYDINRRKDSKQDNEDDDDENVKVLYKTETYLEELGRVIAEFSVQTQK